MQRRGNIYLICDTELACGERKRSYFEFGIFNLEILDLGTKNQEFPNYNGIFQEYIDYGQLPKKFNLGNYLNYR